jgi:hypothetical protein
VGVFQRDAPVQGGDIVGIDERLFPATPAVQLVLEIELLHGHLGGRGWEQLVKGSFSEHGCPPAVDKQRIAALRRKLGRGWASSYTAAPS